MAGFTATTILHFMASISALSLLPDYIIRHVSLHHSFAGAFQPIPLSILLLVLLRVILNLHLITVTSTRYYAYY